MVENNIPEGTPPSKFRVLANFNCRLPGFRSDATIDLLNLACCLGITNSDEQPAPKFISLAIR